MLPQTEVPDLGKFRLRTSGPILDRDTTARDGIYGQAGGRAKCKPGERLITGGSQARAGETATPYMRIVDQGPVPAERAWQVRWASDMGEQQVGNLLLLHSA